MKRTLFEKIAELPQTPAKPKQPLPIVAVGAGNIVRTGHIPAARALGIPYCGFFDIDAQQANQSRDLAGEGVVFRDFEDATRHGADVVYDVAVPADQICEILKQLPDGSGVLIQKPFGRDLAEAERLQGICHDRSLKAAVNFQLRSAPNIMPLISALESNLLGPLREIEVRVVVNTPWSNWAFLAGIPRLEVLYHSIHYFDLIRSLAGEPQEVHAISQQAEDTKYSDVGVSALLRTRSGLRTIVHTDHGHDFGSRHAASEVRMTGSRGAAVARMGVNLDYPTGLPDTLEIAEIGGEWNSVPLRGNWFPEAFEGPMGDLQRHITEGAPPPPTHVDDAVNTMALVETVYRAISTPGTPLIESAGSQSGTQPSTSDDEKDRK